jgi:hypothetical protein
MTDEEEKKPLSMDIEDMITVAIDVFLEVAQEKKWKPGGFGGRGVIAWWKDLSPEQMRGISEEVMEKIEKGSEEDN